MLTLPRNKPPFWFSTLVCVVVAALYYVLCLYEYGDQTVPPTYGLPLLLGLWHRHRSLHAASVLFYCALATGQIYGMLEADAGEPTRELILFMTLANILTIGLVVDLRILSHTRLLDAKDRLEASNADLEEKIQELAIRDEEISSQNEELQRQTEELEQQMEELQQQAEQLQQQGEQMQRLHEESIGRERILRALLEVATRHFDSGPVTSAHRICEMALMAFGEDVTGALLFIKEGEHLVIRGYTGIHDPSRLGEDWLPRDPFAHLVLSEQRPAAIEDLSLTPEIRVPAGVHGGIFHAVIAAPVPEGDKTTGVLALYSTRPRAWSEGEFKIAQWLAVQAGLVMRAARLQEELDQRTQLAEEASRRKTRFLAAVSHDVRTPANVINLMAEVIKQSATKPECVPEIPQMAASLQNNAKSLVELVSDVLDISRFDSGKIDLDLSEFSLREVIEAETSHYLPLARESGLELHCEFEDDPIWLATDRMKLARVLGNLIGNAIKFTESGEVRITCRHRRAAGTSHREDGIIEIEVSDTGIGISPAHQAHIFDEFYQIKNPERDRNKGTGLGLAICKRLIDAIGCSLVVRSVVGEGSAFTVCVPGILMIPMPADAAGDATTTQATEVSGSPLEGRRVLIVEDHDATRRAISTLLAGKGATIEQAENGRAALRILHHQTPDIVLLDLMLPDMDGREILKHLQGNRPAGLHCLFAVSGDNTLERRQEVQQLGADGLIAKPVPLETLIAAIASRLASSDTASSSDSASNSDTASSSDSASNSDSASSSDSGSNPTANPE